MRKHKLKKLTGSQGRNPKPSTKFHIKPLSIKKLYSSFIAGHSQKFETKVIDIKLL